MQILSKLAFYNLPISKVMKKYAGEILATEKLYAYLLHHAIIRVSGPYKNVFGRKFSCKSTNSRMHLGQMSFADRNFLFFLPPNHPRYLLYTVQEVRRTIQCNDPLYQFSAYQNQYFDTKEINWRKANWPWFKDLSCRWHSSSRWGQVIFSQKL